MPNHLAILLFKVLKAYGVSITQHTIKQTINTHPELLSMQCISDALDSWKVKHTVVKLTLEKLRTLDIPVIVHLKKGEYVWVTQITDSKVHFWSAFGKKGNKSHEHFEKEWSGVALAIEDVEEAGEPNYREVRRKEIKENIIRYFFAGGCMALVTILTYFSWKNDSVLPLLPKLLLLLVNAAGCYISYTLILQENCQAKRLVQKFCKAGAHNDCNKVTTSQYSKLFGLFSWAELGLAYFSAAILWVILAPVSAHWISPLWWLFLAPLPLTVWSLFTQAFFIRKWCLFCCAIVLLLWVNAGILYFSLPFGCVFPIVESVLAALLILTSTVAVLYVSKTGKSGEQYSEQREIARIKYDFKTVQCQLSELRLETNHVGFVLGNSQASHEITLYLSIACSHCGRALKELRRLTDIYPLFCYRLIFAVKTDDFEHTSNAITRHLISLYKTLNTNEFFDVLDGWYAMPKKSLEALQKAYPASSVQDDKEELNALYQFGQQAKITYTPALLLNGQILSQLYSYRDLYGIVRALNAEES